MGVVIPRVVARILLCGILSDTVNLTSPTTTPADCMICTLLVCFADEEHPNILAQEMFKAKTAFLTNLGAFDLVRADSKVFNYGGRRFAWATVEVNDPDAIMAKAEQIIIELRILKKEKECDFAFLSVVNLPKKTTDVIICGVGELELLKAAFNGQVGAAVSEIHDPKFGHMLGDISHHHYNPETTKMDIGEKMSRKLEFVPPVANLLDSGWEIPNPDDQREKEMEVSLEVETEHTCTEAGCTLIRKYSLSVDSVLNMSNHSRCGQGNCGHDHMDAEDRVSFPA